LRDRLLADEIGELLGAITASKDSVAFSRWVIFDFRFSIFGHVPHCRLSRFQSKIENRYPEMNWPAAGSRERLIHATRSVT
jgi:hypothetical protein